MKTERQKVLAQIIYALRVLDFEPDKARVALTALAQDLLRQERLEAGRRDAHETRRQER